MAETIENGSEDILKEQKALARKSWLGRMFTPKPVADVIRPHSTELDIRVSVDKHAEPTLTIMSKPDVIATIAKSMRRNGMEVPVDGGGINLVFQGEEAIAPMVEVLEKVNRHAAHMGFEPLRKRVSYDDMDGVADVDLKVLELQTTPTISMVGSIIRLAVRDRQDILANPELAVQEQAETSRRKQNWKTPTRWATDEPEEDKAQAQPRKAADPAARAATDSSTHALSDRQLDRMVEDMIAADAVERAERLGVDWNAKTSGASVAVAPAVAGSGMVDQSPQGQAVGQKQEDTSLADDDDLSFTLNHSYTVKKGEGLPPGLAKHLAVENGGGGLIELPEGTDKAVWAEEARDLREAVGNSGVVTVQRYNKPDTEKRGFIIAAHDTDRLLSSEDGVVSSDRLARRIRSAVRAEQRFVETGTTERVKKAVFSLPDDFTSEQRHAYIKELQDAFGEGGKQYVKEYRSPRNPEMFGFQVIGTTREELTAGGGMPINNHALQAKIAEKADDIRREVPLGDMPDMSKSAILFFPRDMEPERRRQYIERLRQLYPENGERIVREFRSPGKIDKTGIKIIGVTIEELMDRSNETISNIDHVNKMREIIGDSKAKAAPFSKQEVELTAKPEHAAGAIMMSSDAKEMVATFMREVREGMHDYDRKCQTIRSAFSETESRELVRTLAKQAPNSMIFPEGSQLAVVRNIPKSEDELKALVSALVEEGYTASRIINGNNIAIEVKPEKTSSYVARVSADDGQEKAEQQMRSLLERAFSPQEVTLLMGEYQSRNPQNSQHI